LPLTVAIDFPSLSSHVISFYVRPRPPIHCSGCVDLFFKKIETLYGSLVARFFDLDISPRKFPWIISNLSLHRLQNWKLRQI